GKTHNYVFEKEINGEIVKIKIKTKSALEETEKNYIKALLVGLKSLYFPGKIDTMSEIESEMVFRIANMINIRSGETGSHVNRVSKISYILAIDYGFSEKEAEYIKNGAVLHDAGKVGIPDEILNKPGKLTDEEFSIMKEHTLLGFEILKNSRLDVFNYAALIALQHHERWDGNGYPYNLSHEEIADEARIVEVADVFEALTHDRCYRPAWPVEKAVEYIVDMSGKQFDPRVVEIFKRRVNDIVNILTNNPD
ncbi:MAG: HD-GYP domain-containing protein, partial [Fervidobacterium sp.]